MFGNAYSAVRDLLLDFIFPRLCIGCGSEGEWVCRKCLGEVEIIKQPFCPECRRPSDSGRFCNNCRPKLSLEGIFICANFGDGVLKEAVHHFKYNHLFDIGGVLGRLMAARLVCNNSQRFDMVVPVPLHKARRKWRGFNQAEILAKVVSSKGLGDSRTLLARRRCTRPQAELGREERLTNLRDAFIYIGAKGLLNNKNVLLVDDITTTGATLQECARVLKNNGAASVWGIVLAKGK